MTACDNTRGLIATVCLSAFLVSLDSYIVNVSLPTLQREFHSSLGTISWVLLSYLLLLASTSLIFGRLADRRGVKPLFMGGYAVFMVSSVLCGLAPGVWSLVAARCLQALGGAMLVVSGYAAIPRFVPEEMRGRAFGFVATAGASGVIAGAPIGGIINGFLSWPWIFFINVPLCAIGMVVASRGVPHEDTQPDDSPFDVPGAILTLVSLLSLAWVLSKGHELGWRSPLLALGSGVWLVTLAAFVWRERTCQAPLLDPRIFAHGRFTLAVLAQAAGFAFLGGSNFLMPFYLEGHVGMRPQDMGFVLMIYCLVYVATAPHAGRASDRFEPLRMAAAAMGAAAGTVVLFVSTLGHTGYGPAVTYLVLLGIACGFFIAPVNHAIMGAVPPEQRGAASGVMNVVGRMSLVLGISLFQAVYSSLGPGGTPVPTSVSTAAAAARDAAHHMDVAFCAAYGLGAVLCLLGAAASYAASKRQPC